MDKIQDLPKTRCLYVDVSEVVADGLASYIPAGILQGVLIECKKQPVELLQEICRVVEKGPLDMSAEVMMKIRPEGVEGPVGPFMETRFDRATALRYLCTRYVLKGIDVPLVPSYMIQGIGNRCVVCGLSTFKKCTICGTYYCSDKCRDVDGQFHKGECVSKDEREDKKFVLTV